MFAKHSWYFRNALVRANYNDYQQEVYATPEYLMKFFGNLLLGESNELKNRYLRVITCSDRVEERTKKLETREGGQNIQKGGQKRWSEKVVRLLSLVKETPAITRKELSESLGINPSAVQKHIEKLKSEGFIIREGSDKKGVWKVIDKQNNK